MCGIAGLVDLNGLDENEVRKRLSRALARLAPRGPDGEGIWADGSCAFGHRRLAILDLSPTGAQPMSAAGYVITFNGEIFNFRALRADLMARGHRFESLSDTEVILAGWREWGEGLLPRLIGMFAFAIWDPAQRALYMARDRFGEKPLFFAQSAGRIAFASDLLALEETAGQRFPLDPAALRLLFALRYIPEPYCIGRGARKLGPGQLLMFRDGQLTVSHWYRRPAVSGAVPSVPDAMSMLRTGLDAAVADRLVSDVPVGTFLSGGIDSAIVTASMVRQTDRVRTFTIGFADTPRYYDERPEAAAIARHLGTDHTEIALDSRDALAALDSVFNGLDEPFSDSSSVASFVVSREARRHIKVALSGDGADEIFGGYRKYQGELYNRLYTLIPAALRRGIIEPLVARLPESKSTPTLEAFRRMKRFVAAAGEGPIGRHAGWARQLTEDELDALVGPSTTVRVEDLIAGLIDDRTGDDSINQALAIDTELGLPGDMLVKVDRMSMANGLEVRCPFLDQRVVETAFALPGDMKVRRRTGKWILRQAFSDRLPEEVFRHPKKGFEIPVAEWLVGPLLDRARAAVDPERLRRQGLFNPELPARWLAMLKSGQRDTSWQLWTLISFQSWANTHGRPEAAG